HGDHARSPDLLMRLVSAADMCAGFSSCTRSRSGFESVATDAWFRFRRRCGFGTRLDEDTDPPFMRVVAAGNILFALKTQLAPVSVLLACTGFHVDVNSGCVVHSPMICR